MEMISKYIGDILLRQDNVVVPNLGGFVARQMPARFSDASNRILPPYKQLLFRSELNLSDGIFERFVANREQISLQSSTELVRNAVTVWLEQLKQGHRVDVDRVGILFFDESKKIRFEQDRDYNLLLQSYGLGEVSFNLEVEVKETPAVEKANIVEQTLTYEPTVSIVPISGEKVVSISDGEPRTVLVQDAVTPLSKSRSVWYRVAAAAVLLPFVFYSFWVPLTTDVLQTKKLAFSDFNPFGGRAESSYSNFNIQKSTDVLEPQTDIDAIVAALPDETNYFNFTYDEELILAVKFRDAVEPNIELPIASSPGVVGNRIHFISGCFGVKKNVENHLNYLRSLGYQPYIVDVQGGLHRVAVAGTNNQSEIHMLSSNLKEKGIDVWTLKK